MGTRVPFQMDESKRPRLEEKYGAGDCNVQERLSEADRKGAGLCVLVQITQSHQVKSPCSPYRPVQGWK